MLDREKIDVSLSTIAVITVPPKQPVSVNEKELGQVIRPPLAIGQAPEGLFVGSQRDQIEIIAGGNKINVRDLSGSQDFSKRKVATVLHYFVKITEAQIKSYGINFIFTMPCIKPSQWILDNILTSQISEKINKPLIGGWAQLKIKSDRKDWNIKIEPKDDDIIAIDFNAHEDITELPNEKILLEEMQEQFDSLMILLTDLGLG